MSVFNTLGTFQSLSITEDDTWTDADCSSYIPSGATGVILHISNTHATETFVYGLRKKGSTDDLKAYIGGGSPGRHCWALIGVDSSRVFQYRALATESSGTSIVKLVGYTMAGVVFLTNEVDYTPGSAATWTTKDATSDTSADAIGLIWHRMSSTGACEVSAQKYGSTDDIVLDCYGHHQFSMICGCDSGQQVETYSEILAYGKIYLSGYIESTDVTLHTNWTDVSLGSVNTWTEIEEAAPDGSAAVFVQVKAGVNRYFGLRTHGSSEDIVLDAGRSPIAVIAPNADGDIDGYIEATSVDFYTVGYCAVSAATTSIKAVCGVAYTAIGKINGIAIADIKQFNGVSNVS